MSSLVPLHTPFPHLWALLSKICIPYFRSPRRVRFKDIEQRKENTRRPETRSLVPLPCEKGLSCRSYVFWFFFCKCHDVLMKLITTSWCVLGYLIFAFLVLWSKINGNEIFRNSEILRWWSILNIEEILQYSNILYFFIEKSYSNKSNNSVIIKQHSFPLFYFISPWK